MPKHVTRCANPDKLHLWIQKHLQLNIPRKPFCATHQAPFDYLVHAYFEPSTDVIVWGPRGGGKTRLAAIATLLDLLHKPGIAVRILGGSLEQSLRMWEHLLPDLQLLKELADEMKRPPSRKLVLKNRSTAAVLTQSQRNVRGLRVQKMRCDEVEMFDKDVWEAAQLVTRSIPDPKRKFDRIAGVVEAFSTMHKPWGLMSRIIDSAGASNTPIVRWCLLDVLERCPPERDCTTCSLWEECRGRAKTDADGFFSIDDAIAMKKRVSRETWEAEMLCLRPSMEGSVFPSFKVESHVRDEVQIIGPVSLAIDFGFSNPFVCLWIRSDGHLIHVLDEYVQPQRTIHEHIEQIRTRKFGDVRRIACDPAGSARSDQTATSNVATLRQAGFDVHTRRSNIVDGVEMIRTAIRNGEGVARLFIHPYCKRLIRAMQSYRYPDGGGELPLKDGEHDHLIDALRYHMVNAKARPTKGRTY